MSEFAEFIVATFRAVAGFAAVARRHPDGFDGLAVRKSEKIADRSVRRDELLFYIGLADEVAFIGKLAAEGQGQCGKLLQPRPPLAVEAVQQLAKAVGSLPKAFDQISKLLIQKT